MLPPLIVRSRNAQTGSRERGFTMAMVAAALVSIIAMAALSIDVGTLYQAKAEAQRSADAAALTAARMISISGITGDPTNGATDTSWGDICGGATSPATLAAINVAQQNLIAGIAPSSVTVNYGAGSAGASTTDCQGAGQNFGVNPVVTVAVQRTNLPIFFARIFTLFGSNFSSTSVGATATAEVYNPSSSGLLASGMIPVQPRCVKPLIVANFDPINATTWVNASGVVTTQGISQINGGVIGENYFTIRADCVDPSIATNCEPPDTTGGGHMKDNPPIGTGTYLDYIPALISGTPGGVPACSNGSTFQEAIGGCDQSTVYACGVSLGTQADLTINPGGGTGDTSTAAQCITHASTGGADSLSGTAATPTFPFQILPGGGNALVKTGLVGTTDTVTSSGAIMTLPIANFGIPGLIANQPPVTIVGFLQVFVQSVDTTNGNLRVTVMNVAGCSNRPLNPPVTGTSPVPVRLITTP